MITDLQAMACLQQIGAKCANAASPLHECLEGILGAAIELTGADKGNVQLFDPEDATLKIGVHRGFEAPFLAFFAAVGTEDAAACGAAMRNGCPTVVDDVARSEVFAGQRSLEVLLDAGVRAVQSTPLISSAGTLLGMISTHMRLPHRWGERDRRLMDLLARQSADFLERRYAHAQLQAAHEALKKADRRKDEFLATLAHELRNPLAPVRNAAHFLRSRELADPEVKRSVGIIDRQVAHIARLIDDLLDLSRISRGLLQLRSTQVEFARILESAVDACRNEIDSRGHLLNLELPVGPIVLEGDPDRLVQVLSNLLSNAAKYTPDHGRIGLEARTVDDVLVVSVKDNGIGIASNQLLEILEMFSRPESSLERQGSLGIGLALAHQLVALHRGTIEAASEGPGRGSTFVVRLPMAKAPTRSPSSVDARQPASPRRVLIADDNLDSAESLSLVLQMHRHVVRTALDGEAALRAAGEFRPQVALLDLGMPKLDGCDLARRIRAEGWGRSMYLVAVTGWGQESDRQRARDAGFNAHLVKPVSPEELLQLVSSATC